MNQPGIAFDVQQEIFAMLLDKPGCYAVARYRWPVEGTSAKLFRDWFNSDDENLPEYATYYLEDCAIGTTVLPMLTDDAAQEALLHSHYSGAPLLVTACVRAHRGADAMHDYADTQNMYSMPGAPAIPEDELRWVGSGLGMPA